jgi:putative Mg2+ transporter-C (MgtC) family protein
VIWWEVIVRLAASMVIGGVVGVQREFQRNTAGFRTHMLVALGSCAAMLTNEYLFRKYSHLSTMDISRMGSYVISGIGFLGAGSIIKDGFHIRGLTTAAGLWVVACLGIAAGAGFYLGAGAGTLLVVLILAFLKTVEAKFIRRKDRVEIALQIRNLPFELANLLHVLGEAGLSIRDVKMTCCDEEWMNVLIIAMLPHGFAPKDIRNRLGDTANIRITSIEFT